MRSGLTRRRRRNEMPSGLDRMSHDRVAPGSPAAPHWPVCAPQPAPGLIGHASADAAGPTFSASGPNAQTYGAAEGYPVPDPATARRQGNPWEPRDRVGAFTHIDAIYPTRLVKRAAAPWSYKRAPAALSDPLRDRVTGYLSRNPVTGLLIARGRSDPVRALPVWADRPRPVRFAIDGQVDHRLADRHRHCRRCDQIGR